MTLIEPRQCESIAGGARTGFVEYVGELLDTEPMPSPTAGPPAF